MSTVKEICQEISKDQYEKYHAIDSVDKMRRQIQSDLVPHIFWKDWYGCRMVEEDDHYYLYHVVARSVEWSC